MSKKSQVKAGTPIPAEKEQNSSARLVMAAELPTVGARINHSGNLGTIRFVGNVLKTTGIWLGVEWDDPQRGRHDGVKDGHRYFSCL